MSIILTYQITWVIKKLESCFSNLHPYFLSLNTLKSLRKCVWILKDSWKFLERLVHYSSPSGTIVQLLTIIMWCGSCAMLFPLLAKSHPSPDQCVCQETMRDQLCHTDYCRQTVSVPTRLHTLETRALYSATTYYAQIERINQQNQSKPYFQG